ncbi:Flavin-dependent oxidoreductase, luciferase family (includes alkanesulfonate monooxygenase SsuD and methylene tetrahydromethanopterin reductase) [Streptosporangium canum]|uniref:Flavin-dependent oxidoreductase, luciferase family (Includes alkanesulfonate monooxygenase SsuD and methylene tetrahydromethanopterin reductase) n=1 Tax=Streptosporangium canum TaxID=324952 RepID=A0A1I3GFK1_9ACTN|nr:LLM class flavin-dependent oxidoreductase [Streptosporangium canum]SFI22305.1 Flavin-dependent oxidoreductase, luciferase family (includes alkanesulfonate monooxygenase SsuD and methylene tetrahydromethanopterin reductase) [Streptosporangium canum]
MEVGIGLPTMIPGITGRDVLVWAQRAEELGFSSLGVLDRLMYDGYESLIALAAAAGATSRIRLATTILIAAYRGDRALLTKQLASLDRLSDGRLVVGVAAGGRPDDYEACGTPYAGRGRRLDDLLGELRRSWDGTAAGPVPGPRWAKDGPPLLVGGHSPAAMRRAAAFGDGWIAGGSSAAGYAELAERVRTAWRAAGRADRPRLAAIAYVALGPGAREQAERYLLDYYSFIGWKAEMAVRGVLTDARRLQEFAAGYRAAGCDELILFPCVPDPAQADLIAGAVWR